VWCVNCRARSCAARGLWLLALLSFAFGQERLAAITPFESSAPLAARGQLDQLVFARLEALQLQPARLCSDAVFVRRVYLDLTGSIPTAFAAQRFILDRDPGKRGALIESLLARDEFADYLAMKWGDVLRIKAEFPINLWPNAAQAYHRWLRQAIRENKPWDQFARELLTASGSNFDNPPVNFFRAMPNRSPAGIAQAVALTFLGQRADQWPSNDLANLAVFFANVAYKSTAEWKEEIVYFNPASTNHGALNGAPCLATFPDGTRVQSSPIGWCAIRRSPAAWPIARGPGCLDEVLFKSRTTSARIILRAIPRCWIFWKKNSSPRVMISRVCTG
jgi:hypothetical protein